MLAYLMTSDQTSTTTTTTTTSRPYSLRLAHRPITRANPVPVSCKVLPIIQHHATLCSVLGFSKHLWRLAPARALPQEPLPSPSVTPSEKPLGSSLILSQFHLLASIQVKAFSAF